MTYCCSQCSFTAQFESALLMHRQLYHEGHKDERPRKDPPYQEPQVQESSKSPGLLNASFSSNKGGSKYAERKASATRLFGKIRSRICRSRTLFSHDEDSRDLNAHAISAPSECTSKAYQLEPSVFRGAEGNKQKETFGCHLCPFDADRITVLDRHLLNVHKIGMDNLLKLVLVKTKDGLAEENTSNIFDMRQPYYKPVNEIVTDGEFVVETVTPKIKILKHSSTNTETPYRILPDLKDNCRMISLEMEKLIKMPAEKYGQEEFLNKMQTLNEYMCKFVDSSNTLKKVLNKEYGSKPCLREMEPLFNLALESQESPREWERAHSEMTQRNRPKEHRRKEKTKYLSESFFF